MPDSPFKDLGLHAPFEAAGKPEPSERADKLRVGVTLLFSVALVVFLGVFLCAALTIQNDKTWTQAKEAFGIILPALTGILGTVIGFYFGNKEKSQ
jgi:drug/metabolite transporter (DMT)-like permease